MAISQLRPVARIHPDNAWQFEEYEAWLGDNHEPTAAPATPIDANYTNPPLGNYLSVFTLQRSPRADFQRLTPELLNIVFLAMAPIINHRDISTITHVTTFHPWHPTRTTRYPTHHTALTTSSPWFSLRLTSRAIDASFRHWFYGTGLFTFASPLTTLSRYDAYPYTSAGILAEWLHRIGTRNFRLIKRLHLKMYTAEFLMLFAPPEARRMLRMTRAVPAGSDWWQTRDALRGMSLNELVVEILPATCPEPYSRRLKKCPCNSQGCSLEDERYTPDLDWIFKAVVEHFGFVREFVGRTARGGGGEIGMSRLVPLVRTSWEALKSRAGGFHRCDALWENEMGWRREGEGNGRCEYRVPVLRSRGKGFGLEWEHWGDRLECIGELWGEC